MNPGQHANTSAGAMGCGFVFLGTALFSIGICFGISSLRQSSGSQSTYGTVVALEQRRDWQTNEPSYIPVVEYEVKGQRYRIKGTVGFQPPAHKVGQVIRVLYRDADPSEGYLDSFFDQWLLPLVFSCGGALFAVVGYVMLWYRRKRRGDGPAQAPVAKPPGEPAPRFPLSDRVKELARDPARKIEAIKVYREETGAGLAEAKEAVEAYINRT